MACALTFCAAPCSAYSVLTHEAIIDAAWDTSIKPVLLKRFPATDADKLKEAHGYAYGGAIVQDMGYYPHGSKFFSDLAHYVRSGDFVKALLRDAQDVDEYAFALGALAHYAADNDGHRMGVNRAVPLLYPKLEKKYGDVVTYEDDPLAHVKTEFGFDVLEVAKGRYAPESYHDFIGFNVAQRVLEQAFQETYGLRLDSVFGSEDRAIGSYRHDVSTLIPKATKIAWNLKKDEIEKDLPGTTKQKFLYNISRASYEKSWGKDYQEPTFFQKFLAFLYRILPKVGPLRVLSFHTPTPQAEKLFQSSFNATLEKYRGYLKGATNGGLDLPNDNIDVGEVTARGKYRLYDKASAELIDRLAKTNFAEVSPELRENLLAFYAEPAGSGSAKMKDKDRKRLQAEVEQLKAASLTAAGRNNVPDRLP